jgi:hypothetical protein
MPKEVEGLDRLGIRLLLPAFCAVVSLEPAQLFRRRDPDLCQGGLMCPRWELNGRIKRTGYQGVPDVPLPFWNLLAGVRIRFRQRGRAMITK